MQLIDTHAHIYEATFQKELPSILKRATESHVNHIYMPNIDATTIASMMEVATLYPTQCFPMIGIHPCYITKNFDNQLYIIEEWLMKSKFIAIGEIGIDLYHDTSLLKQQEEVFSIQLALAKKHQLPVAIHSRNSFKEVRQIVERVQDGSLQGVIHCFTGNLEEAKQCIALGFSLGIGGILTLPDSTLPATLAAIPLDHIVLETDSPYLAPFPHRKKRNEPSYLLHTATKLAAIQQTTLAEVAAITTRNALKIFKTIV